MLWGRAANRCAFPDCRRELVMDATETDDESVIGDECHIVAREVDGPRGQSPLTGEERDKYDNLLLLCKIHHKLIDDQPSTYTVEILKEMRKSHLDWVKSALDFDSVKQRDDEVYSTFIETWAELANINEWKAWTSFVLGGGQPSILIERDAKLYELRDYLFSRIWPKRYPDLEAAFENFRKVLQDFQNTFHEYSKKVGDYGYETEKFYQIREWDEERYEILARRFDFHVDLVQDLMLELTRAANYICDKIRKNVLPTYRVAEGLILAESGPHMDLRFHTYRLEYRGDEREEIPYPGLERFKQIRETRDVHFGIGSSSEDPKFIKSNHR